VPLPLRALLVVFAGAWCAAAWYLWQTSVPAGLELPDLEPSRFFSRSMLAEADSYGLFLDVERTVSVAALVAVLAVYAAKGAVFVRESAAGRIGTGMLLGMLGLGLVWLFQIGFGLAELWWQRRHDLSRQGYVEWVLEDWWALGAEFLFVSLALLIVMGLAGPLGNYWWLLGAPVFVGLGVLFAFLFPYLTSSERTVRPDRELAADARRIAAEQGVADIPFRVEQVSDYTTVPNAYAAGLGPSRTVVLWDTFLDGRFTDGQLRTVLAHEYGHHAHDHLWKAAGWFALFAFPGAALVALATRRRGGMREPEAVPLGLFVLVVLQLLAQPVFNEFSRRLEAEADWAALETTRDPDAAAGVFRAFTRTALQDPEPPGWAYVLQATHPSVMERIAMAEAWRARQGGRSPAG
jgi:STE24 endopeptidase